MQKELKYKVGDEAIVIAKIHGHRFPIGEEVEITFVPVWNEVEQRYGGGYECSNGIIAWWLEEDELGDKSDLSPSTESDNLKITQPLYSYENLVIDASSNESGSPISKQNDESKEKFFEWFGFHQAIDHVWDYFQRYHISPLQSQLTTLTQENERLKEECRKFLQWLKEKRPHVSGLGAPIAELEAIINPPQND